MDNAKLKETYNEMHKKGPESWFDDGSLEREAILKMGNSWDGLILEIGCGEGDLMRDIASKKGGSIWLDGIDYSPIAIKRAVEKNEGWGYFSCSDYREWINNPEKESRKNYYKRIVMQGVLEHLDDPFNELQWMMDNLLVENGDVISSSPCFVNPRGIVWMTLNMLGAVMSKTDLHYLNPWDFEKFCAGKYKLQMSSVDVPWGYGGKMIKDLEKRIPLALQDGNLKLMEIKTMKSFLGWLERCSQDIPLSWMSGAVGIYRITK